MDETTAASSVTHTYETSGTMSVTLTVSDGSQTASVTQADLLQTCQKDVYVSTTGTAEMPFASWATATSNLNDAVAAAVDGCIVHISNGTYKVKNQVSVTKALRIVGESGDWNDVSVEATNGNRCFYVDNADAILANMTIHGDTYETGRSVRFVNRGGTISNCWVKCVKGTSYLPWACTASAIGGANATIKRCIFSGEAQMHTGDSWNAGSVLTLDTSVISDSIICNTTNRYAYKEGSCGNVVALRNHSTMLNCSIVNADNVITNMNVAALFLDNTSYATNSLIYDIRAPEGIDKFTVRNGTNNLYRCASDDEAGTLANCVRITAADFKNAAGGNYTPASGGALYNAGTTNGLVLSSIDLAGKARVQGKRIDIGCYEASNMGMRVICR